MLIIRASQALPIQLLDWGLWRINVPWVLVGTDTLPLGSKFSLDLKSVLCYDLAQQAAAGLVLSEQRVGCHDRSPAQWGPGTWQ